MKVLFRPEAADEFSEAVRFYNEERPGLGFDFANEVRNALNRIETRICWHILLTIPGLIITY